MVGFLGGRASHVSKSCLPTPSDDFLDGRREHSYRPCREKLQSRKQQASRISEKAAADYDGDVARVCDVERATGVFDSVAGMTRALELLRRAVSSGGVVVCRFKDRLGEPLGSGYRDLLLNVAVGGFVGELQRAAALGCF